jgi:hypothetical protein
VGLFGETDLFGWFVKRTLFQRDGDIGESGFEINFHEINRVERVALKRKKREEEHPGRVLFAKREYAGALLFIRGVGYRKFVCARL